MSRNTSNVHGISCSDDKDVGISPSAKTIDVNSELREIIRSKLQQLANVDLRKSVVNDYFNNEFKNSNFYKYMENFHKVDPLRFNESAIFNYFNNDFQNSRFYKYLESLRDNQNASFKINESLFKYFDNDFKNSNFVKYLDDLMKAGDNLEAGFSNSTMYNYFNRDFRESYFFKYLENVMNSNYSISSNFNTSNDPNYRILLTITVILLFVLVLLKIINFLDFRKKTNRGRQNIELLKA
ncbi:hypothetical protein JTB14_018698 [Gonioctena quinquepunctata]|nr:hypothetical protein JTB14_018698 [Gonioctena quinquepunctata]